MEQPEFHASELIVVQIHAHPLLLNSNQVMSTFMWCKQKPTVESPTTRLTPSSLGPVSFLYDTTNSHTLIMFANTSTRPGVERSFVMMALRSAGRDAIQSRVSAPFKRFFTNYVIENGSRLPNTDAAFRWIFSSWRSNVGYSTSLARYPLPKSLAKTSARTCGPPCSDTTDVSGPAACRSLAKIVAPRVVLALNRLKRRNTNTAKCWPFSCLDQHPIIWAALLELDAVLPLRLHPTEHTRNASGILLVQNFRLKHSTSKPMNMDTWTHGTGNYQPTPRRGTMLRQ